ncbi:sugar ABC transporter substrate-binding protein [Streptomyces sp. TP-A0874]|uniref:sugar ABC transporter substrate-binding protein n=1 Tax=Streptomyces sp. TP-A0874 TaxID=549819 RepID=UPI0008539831|nr:sugar ABC transporter substrate-binding protein [Streptomyces sp. TP-A0874]
MHRTPRLTAAVAATAATLGLCSCGASKGEEVAADAKQTLTVWAMGTEGQKLQAVAEAYEKKHPNITVKVTPIGWDTAHQKLVSSAAAGTLPDVAQMGSTYMGEFADLGVLEPVDTKAFQAADFFPASWENNVIDDTAYGVPWYVDTRALFYRTDLAEKAGVTKAPTDWRELSALATAYQEKAGTKWGISLQPRGLDTWQSWLPFLYSTGGELVKDGEPALDSPATVRSLTEYGSYFDKGLAKKSVSPGYDVLKDFNTGAVPMFLSGPWHVTALKEQYPQLDGEWAVAEVPGDTSGTSFSAGSSLVTFRDSAHKAAAEEFISYLTSTEQQTDWYRRTGDLPARQAAWEQGALADDQDLKVFGAQMKTAKAVPALAKWAEFSAELDTAIEKVSQGAATPEKAAAQAQSAASGLAE